MLGQVRRQPAGVATGPDRSAARLIGWRSGLAISLALIALLLGVGLALALRWAAIYPGVRVGSVDLGGFDQTAATTRLTDEAAHWEAAPLTLTGPAGSATFSRHELGLRYDVPATLAAAYAIGHEGSPLDRLGTILTLPLRGGTINPIVTTDEAQLRAHLSTLAGINDMPARDGALRITAGQVIVVPPVEGSGLDLAAAVPLVITAATTPAPEVVLPVAEQIQPAVNSAVLAAAQQRAERFLAQPLRLRGDDVDELFSTATIGTWLEVRPNSASNEPLTVQINQAAVQQAVGAYAPQIRRDTQSATYEYDQRQRAFVVTTAALDGRQLDLAATTAAVITALEGDQERLVAPVVERWRPGLTEQDIAVANQKLAQSYLAGPVVLQGQGQRWLLTPPEVANWITLLPGLTPAAGPRIIFDEQALNAYLASIQGQIDQPAVDAGYTMDDGTDVYRVTSPSAVGRALDLAATLKAALAVLNNPTATRTIALPIQETKPKITEADVAAMQPERWVEVNLSTQRMYAVVGKKRVYTATISSGKRGWETPTGTFYIIYRVENETMTSESIGAEEYYRLENVLYTQYFTGEGHALHYSWWKEPGSFGTPSSHGCLSETLPDAEFFWNFAAVGTRVTIYGQTPLR